MMYEEIIAHKQAKESIANIAHQSWNSQQTILTGAGDFRNVPVKILNLTGNISNYGFNNYNCDLRVFRHRNLEIKPIKDPPIMEAQD